MPDSGEREKYAMQARSGARYAIISRRCFCRHATLCELKRLSLNGDWLQAWEGLPISGLVLAAEPSSAMRINGCTHSLSNAATIYPGGAEDF